MQSLISRSIAGISRVSGIVHIRNAQKPALESVCQGSIRPITTKCPGRRTDVKSGLLILKGRPVSHLSHLNHTRTIHRGTNANVRSEKMMADSTIGDARSGVELSTDKKMLEIHQVEGLNSSFNATWLRHNCHCSGCKQSHSGQRLFEPAELLPSYQLKTATLREGEVRLEWEGEEAHIGIVPISFLVENDYSEEKRAEIAKNTMYPRVCQNGQVPTVSYDEVMSSEHGVLKWLQYLNEEGICLVRDVPCVDGTVRKTVERIWPVQPTIYGEVFDVVSDPKPINVAYSSVKLGFHMDLIYYESAPGIQILHALQYSDGFGKKVEGGESMFVDAWHTAEVLRNHFPHHFKTLSRVPASFQKIHFERENPVYMKYSKPHLECSPAGNITAVNWAPAFEAPLCVPEGDVESYYEAYHQYSRLLEESSTRVEFRLEEGDMISFNNRRILHARKEFKLNGGVRHLQGCYLNIDEFKSRLMVLSKQLESSQPVKHVFNHDWM